MKRLWCWVAGHQWKRVGETYRGYERMPRRILWKCDRCRDEKETHPWMRPSPW